MTKNCELYPRIPADLLTEANADVVLQSGASAVLLTGIDGAATPPELLHAFIAAARSQNVAVLIENDGKLAGVLDADGVHLQAHSQPLKSVRATLSGGALIGASCNLSRHDAMELAEDGADYIAFGEMGTDDLGEVAEMIRWWNEIFEVPSVAWARDDCDDDALRMLVNAGADYLSVPAAYWVGGDAAGKLARLASICTKPGFSVL